MTTVPDLESTIREILAELTTTAAAEIQMDDNLAADLGMDSVAQMEFVSMVAERLDIDIEIEDTMGISDVSGVMALVQKHHPAATKARAT